MPKQEERKPRDKEELREAGRRGAKSLIERYGLEHMRKIRRRRTKNTENAGNDEANRGPGPLHSEARQHESYEAYVKFCNESGVTPAAKESWDKALEDTLLERSGLKSLMEEPWS